MIQAFTGKIQGRVQGVGYRCFAERVAREHGICGWVRNRPDGSVEVMAIGKNPDLVVFLQSLKRGPVSCRVDVLQVDWLKDLPDYRDFSITG